MKKIEVYTSVGASSSYLMEIEAEDTVAWMNNHIEAITDSPEGLAWVELKDGGNNALFVRANTIESIRVIDVMEKGEEEVKVGGSE